MKLLKYITKRSKLPIDRYTYPNSHHQACSVLILSEYPLAQTFMYFL